MQNYEVEIKQNSTSFCFIVQAENEDGAIDKAYFDLKCRGIELDDINEITITLTTCEPSCLPGDSCLHPKDQQLP